MAAGVTRLILLAKLRVEAVDVVVDEQRDIVRPLAERRHHNRHDVEAIVEVLPETALS